MDHFCSETRAKWTIVFLRQIAWNPYSLLTCPSSSRFSSTEAFETLSSISLDRPGLSSSRRLVSPERNLANQFRTEKLYRCSELADWYFSRDRAGVRKVGEQRADGVETA